MFQCVDPSASTQNTLLGVQCTNTQALRLIVRNKPADSATTAGVSMAVATGKYQPFIATADYAANKIGMWLTGSAEPTMTDFEFTTTPADWLDATSVLIGSLNKLPSQSAPTQRWTGRIARLFPFINFPAQKRAYLANYLNGIAATLNV